MALCEPPFCCRPPIVGPPGPELGASWSCARCRATYEAVEVDATFGERLFTECIRKHLMTVWLRRMPDPMQHEPDEAPGRADAPYAAAKPSGMEVHVPPVRRQRPALAAGVKGQPLRR